MFIYLIKQDPNLYKIGVSKDPENRCKSLQTANGVLLELVKKIPVKHDYRTERALHNYFSSKKTIGEWFCLEEKDVESFETICEFKEKNFKILSEQNSYVIEKGRFI